MNNLSWMIYLIGVVDGLGVLAVAFSIIFGIGTVFSVIVSAVCGFNPNDKDCQAAFPFVKRARAIIIGVFVVAVATAVFTPSRQTMILIAGSEIGERVVKSDKIQSIVDPSLELLKVWIKKETDRIINPPQDRR